MKPKPLTIPELQEIAEALHGGDLVTLRDHVLERMDQCGSNNQLRGRLEVDYWTLQEHLERRERRRA